MPDAKAASSPSSHDKVTLSPPSSPLSDTSPGRGTMKGNIKVRLLLGRYNLLPTTKEQRHGKSDVNRVRTKMETGHTAAAVKEKKKRQRSSQSDESVVSSSEESDVKYSLSDVVPVPARRRGRPSVQPAALMRARARQLVSKALSGLQVDKKPNVGTATTRPWVPFWHGRLQLPTQSSRSSRKITINRRFLDDSYTSIGQSGLFPTVPTEHTATQHHNDSSQPDSSVNRSGTGSHVRGVGLLNRPLGSRPAVKPLRRLPTRDKPAEPRIKEAKVTSKSAHELGMKDIATDAVESRTADKRTEDMAESTDAEAPWVVNPYRSIYSNYSKKGSMLGKHCEICDNSYLVNRHYMCRVPVCRSCARFYKGQCERGIQLDQLTCLEQGKCFSVLFVLIQRFTSNTGHTAP